MKKRGPVFSLIILCGICFLCIFLSVSFISCRKTEVHLHDRHGHSYNIVKNYAEEHGAVNLVLLDYHHDIRPEIEIVNSVDWVGKLVEEDYVKKVIWLSGKKLLLPNRNARMAWLERSLKNTYPETAEKMRQAVTLVDWYDLQEIRLGGKRGDFCGPFVITLDFDVFMKDPGDPAELFVDELCSWIQKQKPQLLTLAFSAAYQPQPDKAWAWLEQFTKAYGTRADWFLESGDFGEKFESLDEAQAWSLWKENSAKFQAAETPFYPGAYFWQNAPGSFVAAALEKNLSAGNESAAGIIKAWKDKDLKTLKEKFPSSRMQELCQVAEAARQEFFKGADFAAPEQNSKRPQPTYGIAVRFRNAGEDRGCLSLYEGVAEDELEEAAEFCAKEALVDPRYLHIRPEELPELYTNISIFGKWEEMDGPFDFEPGFHSLIIEDESGEKTLLQATIALERNYSREEFLARLSNKAGLGFDGWKKNALHFYRAYTITYTDY
jgi:AMMECR1 domain-containing protein